MVSESTRQVNRSEGSDPSGDAHSSVQDETDTVLEQDAQDQDEERCIPDPPPPVEEQDALYSEVEQEEEEKKVNCKLPKPMPRPSEQYKNMVYLTCLFFKLRIFVDSTGRGLFHMSYSLNVENR